MGCHDPECGPEYLKIQEEIDRLRAENSILIEELQVLNPTLKKLHDPNRPELPIFKCRNHRSGYKPKCAACMRCLQAENGNMRTAYELLWKRHNKLNSETAELKKKVDSLLSLVEAATDTDGQTIRKMREALTRAVNSRCICGGGGPWDGCGWCNLYHEVVRLS